VTLAMKNPLDIFAIDEIRLITGRDVEPVIATEEDIILAIGGRTRRRRRGRGRPQGLRDDGVTIEDYRATTTFDRGAQGAVRGGAGRPPRQHDHRPGHQRKASDIHMEPAKDCLKVRYRIDGILQDGLIVPKKPRPA
jgi:type IV pilus assembly protein PilB